MIVNLSNGFKLPRILSQKDLDRCIDFVETELTNRIRSGEKTFSVQSMFGGENYDWCSLGFPIGDIWIKCNEKYENEGYSDHEERAKTRAGIYVGMILKYVCHKVNFNFKIKKLFKQNVYELV